MKHLYALTLMLAAVAPAATLHGAEVLPEPAASKFATGHWVKIKVKTDGIYELSHDKLRSLGFSDPEKVNVYGYAPTVLLTHDLSVMPTDISALQSVHAAGKLLFYGKGNLDYAPELWETRVESDITSKSRDFHVHSDGATYFLSDIPCKAREIAAIAAPEDPTSESPLTSHTAVFYCEEDVTNLSNGGVWFSGPAIGAQNPTLTYKVTLDNVANASARMVYQSLMSPNGSSAYNFLLATYPAGFTSESYVAGERSHGFSAKSVKGDVHDIFSHSIRYQNLLIPVKDAATDYDLQFAVHPQAVEMKGNCALDFFALLYKRKNNVEGKSQLHMYFENWSGTSLFTLSGTEGASWQVWDVTDPANIGAYEFSQTDAGAVGCLKSAGMAHPTQVVAFNPAAAQPEPVIIGEVANQNLHGASTPDMVIVTAAPLMEVAAEVADMHKRLQGLDVMVVDQQQIFNEYSSGNTSPEAVRRFLRHLFYKTPDKLAGVLMLGPGTYNNAARISPESPYVVTYQIEDYRWCTNITRNFCNESFFGHLSSELADQDDLWKGRNKNIRLFGTEQTVPVGRLPLSSPADIRNYYSKVEEYISNPPTYPAWGNIVLSSDYATTAQQAHFADAEGMIKGIEGLDADITVTRSAANFYTKGSNKTYAAVARNLQNRGLADGAMLYSYFGHGSNTTLGSTGGTAMFFDIKLASEIQNPGRYPVAYLGSCNLAGFDKWPNGITTSLLTNPHGGPVAVIASGREVYQNMNRQLGNFFANSLYAANSQETLGKAWMRGYDNAIRQPKLSVADLLNHLDYNLIGDPMLPIFAPTHSAAITSINGNGTIMSLADNVVEGKVLTDNGELATNFNGEAILTIYDVPVTLTNVEAANADNGHVAEYVMDSEIIGRYPGKVTNGKVTVNFNGPISNISGNHRLQLYVYSTDGKSRAYASAKEIAFNYDADAVNVPAGAPTTISDFHAGNGEVGERTSPQVSISATILAPRGLAQASTVMSPVRLTIDGVTKTNVARMIRFEGNNVYSFEYITGELAGGRHECELSVLDASGEWTEAKIEFNVDNSPKATLAASVASGMVDFELTTAALTSAGTLYIENINGDQLHSVDNPVFPLSLRLNPGVYRAFVQLKGENSVTSTPKVDIFVD